MLKIIPKKEQKEHGRFLEAYSDLENKLQHSLSEHSTLEMTIQDLKACLKRQERDYDVAQKEVIDLQKQVILQSETIQELTKTSQALASAQTETSELCKAVDQLKTENSHLKSKWETESSAIEVYKSEADKKYNEVDKLNKILHSGVVALQIKLAENKNDAELEEVEKLVSEKENTISNLETLLSERQEASSLLERDLAGIRIELSDRGSRITEISKNEASLKSELEKARRLNLLIRRSSNKEKEELKKEVQALSKQLEDAKQTKRSSKRPSDLPEETTADVPMPLLKKSKPSEGNEEPPELTQVEEPMAKDVVPYINEAKKNESEEEQKVDEQIQAAAAVNEDVASSSQGGPALSGEVTSTPINLTERARPRSQMRRAGMDRGSPSRGRGRGVIGYYGMTFIPGPYFGGFL